MTEDELKTIEAHLEYLKHHTDNVAARHREYNDMDEVTQDLAYQAEITAADLRALLLEVRRMSPVFAAAMDYAGFMNNDSDIHDREDTLVDACRKAREGNVVAMITPGYFDAFLDKSRKDAG